MHGGMSWYGSLVSGGSSSTTFILFVLLRAVFSAILLRHFGSSTKLVQNDKERLC